MDQVPSLPDAARVLALLQAASCPWPAPMCVLVTESTNLDARVLAGDGAPDGTCVVAGEQTGGRGRHGRRWVSDPGAGLWSSVVVRSGSSAGSAARTPLVAALAVLDACAQFGAQSLEIKWPNDVLCTDGRKLAGILAEATPDAVVVGIGINVDRGPAQLSGRSCCVADVGVSPDRSELLAALLIAFHHRVNTPWEENLAEYRRVCRTLGSSVEVTLPGGSVVNGVGVDVDAEGHLLVKTGQTVQTIIAGDVLHATIAP